MRVIESISEMQQAAESWRREGTRIGLVPTMGYLHEGHLALAKKARELADIVVVSIFVNPTQFGPGEDFERYPQDMERDIGLLTEMGVDITFAPRASEMYTPDYQTYVEVRQLTQPLCGASRPGHFIGVTSVVAKLFNIVKPHVSVFGEKDFQQLVTIQRMVDDLNMDVEVVGHPIVREPDGLAMSSRNTYLNKQERQTALRLNRSLQQAEQQVAAGERRVEAILESVRNCLEEGGGLRIDYAELRNPVTLGEVSRVEGPTLLAMAAYVGKARLIDNCLLIPPGSP
ncbi:pantoate--beta-alanine ligase [Desulfoferrobacter suflitae]|uniref:pantoate--beta-alanine ligase n=1 Tax=Desulfoferrobacter suflitae TaxID=2865782 RepID=UPI00216467BD|nr:pantoate--beta-alanine ligase [Desulfoferrobacter suflitae]MCK8603863.1 pantoate--beta-alanine ligase [Desulfoferrobacter suflitae]